MWTLLVPMFRSLAIMAGGSFLGSWLASEPKNETTQTGLAGWWEASPWPLKLVAGVFIVFGIASLYFWIKDGVAKRR